MDSQEYDPMAWILGWCNIKDMCELYAQAQAKQFSVKWKYQLMNCNKLMFFLMGWSFFVE